MRLLTAILFSCICAISFAQNQKVLPKKSPKSNLPLNASSIQLSIGNAAISMPPVSINGTFHPTAEVGFTKPFKKNSAKQRLSVGTDIGYFNQQHLQSGVYLKPNIQVKIPVFKSFSLVPKLGAGLLVTKNANKEFAIQPNGTYKNMGKLNSQFLGTLGLQPTVNVYNSNTYKYNVFMSYEFAAQTPFSAISSLLPITMMRLGLKVQPNVSNANATVTNE